MSDRFAEAFIEKLILLEKSTGAKVHYRVMPPFTVPFVDCLSIQKSAKDISDFVGLNGFTFIVGVAKQKEKVGGHIDLSTSGPSVFIEIDEKMMKFPDAVAATLCHEVCHKWLDKSGLRLPITIENEILTDVSTVFLGFGKIMLNGCNTKHVRYETVPNGTRTITETMNSGYLDRGQFAFVYRLVCAMRKVPYQDAMQGLNADALEAVQKCDSSLGLHYDDRFHQAETLQNAVAEFDSRITEHQRTLADIQKNVVYTHESFLERINGLLTANHRELSSLRRKAVAMTENCEFDPVLRFLRTIQKGHELDRMAGSLSGMRETSDALLRHTRSICRYFYQHGDRFPVPPASAFSVVTCPQDGTKLRLPENSGNLIATCPTCKYRFAYNTSVPKFQEPIPTTPVTPTRRNSWFSRLFGK